MKTLLLLCFFLLSCLKGFTQPVTDSIKVDDHYRTFSFQPPASGQNGARVIFILHGSGGNGRDMMPPSAGLQKVAPSENLLLVYPDGYKRYWNECRKGATSEANVVDINEQKFFKGMIAYLGTRYRADTSSAFAIGLSGGGHMAYKLGITMPGKFKAISAIVASLPDTGNLDCGEARIPLAVMITNGTGDGLNRYEGGDIIIGGKNWGAIRSTDRTLAYWAELAGYKGQATVTTLEDRDTSNGESIIRHTYRERGKPEVTLHQVVGGGHAFPKDIDIFLESWAFFKRELARIGKVK